MPKRGFTAPVGAWIAGPYAGRYEDEVLGPSTRTGALIDRSILRGWFDEHRAGRADHSYVLWADWVLERWLRNVGTATDATPADVGGDAVIYARRSGMSA